MTIEEAVKIYNLHSERISRIKEIKKDLKEHGRTYGIEPFNWEITVDKFSTLLAALSVYENRSREELQKVYLPTLPSEKKTVIELTLENAIKEAGEFEEVYLPREDAERILTFVKENRVNEKRESKEV